MVTSTAAPAPTVAPATPRADEPPAGATGRLAFIDNMRILMITVVIAHHAGQPYGPTGGSWPIDDARHAPILGAFFAVNAGFGMGLFFLISAAFLPAAYDRKGPRAFLRDRLLRLGVPLLAGTLLMFLPAFYVTEGPFTGGPRAFLRDFLLTYFGPWHFGHLWFLAHLIVATLAYALWRHWRRGAGGGRRAAAPPGDGAILGYIAALALVTYVVRLRFPIDSWSALPLLIPTELAHLPQYASLFVAGLLAGRDGWFSRFPTRRGLRWLAVGFVAAALAYGYAPGGRWPAPGLLSAGGAGGGALLRSLWEAVLCTGLAIGLPVLMRERGNRQGPLLRALAADTYLVYLLHIGVLLGLQAALRGAALPPLVKFGIATLAGVPLCFLLAAGLRRLPGLWGALRGPGNRAAGQPETPPRRGTGPFTWG